MPIQGNDSHITADAKARFGDQPLVLPKVPGPTSAPFPKIEGSTAEEIEQSIDTQSPNALTRLKGIKEVNPEAYAVLLFHLRDVSAELHGTSLEVKNARDVEHTGAQKDGLNLVSNHLDVLYRLALDLSLESKFAKQFDTPTLEFLLREDRAMLSAPTEENTLRSVYSVASVSGELTKLAYFGGSRFDSLVDEHGRKAVSSLMAQSREQKVQPPSALLVSLSKVLTTHAPGTAEAQQALDYLIGKSLTFEKIQPGLGSEYARGIVDLPKHDLESLTVHTEQLVRYVSGLARQGETRLKEAVASLNYHKGEIELSDELIDRLTRLNRHCGLVFSSRLVASEESNKQELFEKRSSHLLEGYEEAPKNEKTRFATFILSGVGDIFGDALSHSVGATVGQLIDQGYRVHLFEIGEEAQLAVALERSEALASRQPELLLIAGHGTESMQQVGVFKSRLEVDGQGIALANDMLAEPRQVNDAELTKLEQEMGWDSRKTTEKPEYLVRVSGHTADSAHLDIEDAETFAAARRHLRADAKVVLLACGSGTTAYEQSASRVGRATLGVDSKRSLGQVMADSFSLPVIAATEAIVEMKLVFDENGAVQDVKFSNSPLGDTAETKTFGPIN